MSAIANRHVRTARGLQLMTFIVGGGRGGELSHRKRCAPGRDRAIAGASDVATSR